MEADTTRPRRTSGFRLKSLAIAIATVVAILLIVWWVSKLRAYAGPFNEGASSHTDLLAQSEFRGHA